MSKYKYIVDASVASETCDVVESLTKIISDVDMLRWRMLRGETNEMWHAMQSARTNTRELTKHLDSLRFGLDAAIDKLLTTGEPPATDYSYTSEELKKAELKVVPNTQEKK